MKKPRNQRRSNNTCSLCGLLLVIAAALTGCVNRDISDLERYAVQVNARPPRTPVEPLPEVQIPETYVYQSGDATPPKRDPFESFIKAAAAASSKAAKVADPKTEALRKEIEGRNPEELEGFDLDALRMVGTLQDNNQLWAIIVDRTGTIHRVQVGNYLGRNFGKIQSISEDKIELREIVSTPDGGLEERPASIALAEQK